MKFTTFNLVCLAHNHPSIPFSIKMRLKSDLSRVSIILTIDKQMVFRHTWRVMILNIICIWWNTFCGLLICCLKSYYRKDEDIVNAIRMVNATKRQLQTFRLKGFDSLLKDIEIVDMEDEYVDPKSKRKKRLTSTIKVIIRLKISTRC